MLYIVLTFSLTNYLIVLKGCRVTRLLAFLQGNAWIPWIDWLTPVCAQRIIININRSVKAPIHGPFSRPCGWGGRPNLTHLKRIVCTAETADHVGFNLSVPLKYSILSSKLTNRIRKLMTARRLDWSEEVTGDGDSSIKVKYVDLPLRPSAESCARVHNWLARLWWSLVLIDLNCVITNFWLV